MNKQTLIGFLTALLASLLLAACAPSLTFVPDTPPGTTLAASTVSTSTPAPNLPVGNGPQLRIKNTGPTDIKNLTVLLPNSQIAYGDVPVGETSDYQPAPNGVYRVAAFTFEMEGKVVTQYVRDWVGESPLPGKSYTYQLSLVNDPGNGPRIDLQEVAAP